MRVERRAGDASAVAGASILASLSSLRQDPSRLKPTSQVSGNEPSSPVIHEDEFDGLEVDSAANVGSSSAADVGLTSKILPLDGNLNASRDAGDVKCLTDLFLFWSFIMGMRSLICEMN